MLGKSCFRLMWLSFVAAFALLMGGQLLRYISLIVSAARLGDYIPLVAVITCSVILLRLSGKYEDREGPLFSLLNILAWGSVIFLATAGALIALPLGIVPMLAIVALIGLFAQLAKNPHNSLDLISQSVRFNSFLNLIDVHFHTITGKHSPTWLRINTRSFSLFIIPKEYESKFIEVMRERPMLPVSMTIFNEFDALVLRDKHNKHWKTAIRDLLQRNKIPYETGSPFLLKLILALPIIENEGELNNARYCIISDQNLIDTLLDEGSNPLTLFPGTEGLTAVCPTISVSGYNVSRLSISAIGSLLINRDTNGIQVKVSNHGHST